MLAFISNVILHENKLYKIHLVWIFQTPLNLTFIWLNIKTGMIKGNPS